MTHSLVPINAHRRFCTCGNLSQTLIFDSMFEWMVQPIPRVAHCHSILFNCLICSPWKMWYLFASAISVWCKCLWEAVNFAIYLIFRRTGRTFFLMLMMRESLHCSDAWRKMKMKMKITSFLYYFEDEDEMPLIVGFDLYDWLCRPALRAFKRRVAYSNACHDHILFFWFM